jgi:hypothetical protein
LDQPTSIQTCLIQKVSSHLHFSTFASVPLQACQPTHTLCFSCTFVYNLLHVCGAAKHQKTCNKQHLSPPVIGTATLCNVHMQPLHVGSLYDDDDDDPHVYVDDEESH